MDENQQLIGPDATTGKGITPPTEPRRPSARHQISSPDYHARRASSARPQSSTPLSIRARSTRSC